jgi:hypothetical protein
MIVPESRSARTHGMFKVAAFTHIRLVVLMQV